MASGSDEGLGNAVSDLPSIYEHRFRDEDLAADLLIWRELARFLQRYVPLEGAVLDLACDRGLFINSIRAARRTATDIRDVRSSLDPEVRFVQSDGLKLAEVIAAESFDTVFMSNYLEHLPSAEFVIEQLRVVHGLLKKGGRVVILQPNIRLVGGAYWDFLDHKTALTERTLVEAADLVGFEPEETVVRFLPYTTKGRLPKHPLLVRLYLAVRPAWILLGKQTLFVGRKP